tara:strand:+ start:729 stop:1628 length:900 start_codon:yes stop_codon:yes gene_type:complete
MSFLKKFDVKGKTGLLIEFFYGYVWKKSTLYLAIASIIFSIGFIQTITPQFYISATLRESQTTPASGSSIGGGASALLSFTSTEWNAIDEFESNLYSYAVAKRMWEKGWATEIYAVGDKEKDPNKIDRRHTVSEKISSFLLGYELYDYYSPHDLQDFITGKISMNEKIGKRNFTFSMLTGDQTFGLNFINELILEADKYSKEYLILKSQALIEGTQKQLAVSRNSAITSSLAGTINGEYLKIATLDNDLPYHIYFVDPPYSSEYPITPNSFAIFFSNFIIFIISSIMFHFIRDNKDDLW